MFRYFPQQGFPRDLHSSFCFSLSFVTLTSCSTLHYSEAVCYPTTVPDNDKDLDRKRVLVQHSISLSSPVLCNIQGKVRGGQAVLCTHWLMLLPFTHEQSELCLLTIPFVFVWLFHYPSLSLCSQQNRTQELTENWNSVWPVLAPHLLIHVIWRAKFVKKFGNVHFSKMFKKEKACTRIQIVLCQELFVGMQDIGPYRNQHRNTGLVQF